MCSARKGFLLTDALVSVFVVFILCGLVFSTSAGYLSAGEAMEKAAEEIEEEAAFYYAESAAGCYECVIREEQQEEGEEEPAASFLPTP